MNVKLEVGKRTVVNKKSLNINYLSVLFWHKVTCERYPYKVDVGGSIPSTPTIYFNDLANFKILKIITIQKYGKKYGEGTGTYMAITNSWS